MHNAGKGVVGMKILGEGRITTPEEAVIRPGRGPLRSAGTGLISVRRSVGHRKNIW